MNLAMSTSIWSHHSATIEAIEGDCEIGRGTKIYQNSTVRNAKLGSDCLVWPGALIDGAEIGDRCKIAFGAMVPPGVKIGNDVFVGPGAKFCNDVFPSVERDGFDIDALRSGQWTVIVEDFAAIGCNATVLPGVRLGEHSLVAAGAVCDHDVPPFTIFHRGGAIRALPADWKHRRMRYAQ